MTAGFRHRPGARGQLVEAIGYGLLNYGHAVETRGKANAPVRGGNRSFAPDGPVGGTLRRSIHTVAYAGGRRIGDGTAVSPTSGVDENGTGTPSDYGPRNEVAVFVGTNSGYGLWVHEGTAVMAARPFLTEAWLATRAEAGALIAAGARRRLGQ